MAKARGSQTLFLPRLSVLRRSIDLVGGSFVAPSAVMFIGFSLASLLGFVFSVVAARLLGPVEFGWMQYGLAVAELAAVLVTTSPRGLSSFLSQYREDPLAATRYYSNWLTVVGAVLILSLVMTAVAGPAVGVAGWLLVGVLANLLGVAALETYREVGRGLGRYVLVSIFYVVSNLLQLAAVLVAAQLGYRSASPFVIIYGLASVVTLIAITLVTPLRVTFSLHSIGREQIREVLRIAPPVLLQSVFFVVWFRADLVLLQRLQTSQETGEYAAAKTLINALVLAPTAISFVVLPTVPRLKAQLLPRFLCQVLALLAIVTVPPVMTLVFEGHPIVGLVFGSRYQAAASPLAILAIGMALFGFCSVLGSLWLGLQRPVVDTASTAVGMLGTVATAPVLIPHFGAVGAAVAFSIGAGLRLMAAGSYTVWRLRARAG